MRFKEKYCSYFQDSKETYGYRRINDILHRDSIIVSGKIVRRITKEEELKVFMVKICKYSSNKEEIT